MIRPALLALLTVLTAAGTVPAGAAPPPPASPLRAGGARVDITPAPETLEHGDTIRDRLYARALVVDDGQTCAVVVALDQGAAFNDMVADAVPRVALATGCPAGNIVISATHTHSSNTAGIPENGRPTGKELADAVVTAATRAKGELRPARIGFGRTDVHLNTNRDVFDGKTWYQGTNREGPSDKTLAVVELLGDDGAPIGVVMNYAMHAIDFYLSGVISGDVPGEASRYVERRYPRAVALFTQGASGDQNPLLIRPMLHLSGIRTRMPDASNTRIDAEDQWKVSARLPNAFDYQSAEVKKPLPAGDEPAYRDALAETGEVVTAMGVILGESAIDVMRNLTPRTAATGRIWSGLRMVTCPARERLDLSARQGVLPPYRDAAPVAIKVGLLRIAGVDLGWVDGEVYSQIGTRLKREVASNAFALVTLANGRTNAGYIASNEAGSHLTFQVIGARLKPGCAEDAIVAAGVDLVEAANGRSGRP